MISCALLKKKAYSIFSVYYACLLWLGNVTKTVINVNERFFRLLMQQGSVIHLILASTWRVIWNKLLNFFCSKIMCGQWASMQYFAFLFYVTSYRVEMIVFHPCILFYRPHTLLLFQQIFFCIVRLCRLWNDHILVVCELIQCIEGLKNENRRKLMMFVTWYSQSCWRVIEQS